MRINEIIVEQQLDEGPLGSAVGAVGRGIGKVIGGVAKGVGAIAGIGAGAKKAFAKGKQASTDVIGGTGQGADAPVQKAAPAATAAAPAAAPAGGGAAQPAAQPAAGGAAQGGAPAAAPAQPAAQGGAAQPAAQPAAKPAAGSGDVDAIIQQVDQLQPPEKKEVLAALQKPAAPAKEEPAAQPGAAAEQPAAEPAAQGGAEQQPNDGLTQGQRDQQQAVQQMKATADANAAASGKNNEAEAAAKAAAAKPGFQRTAADKLAIQKAQEMGIKVEDVEDDRTMIREYVEEYILFKPQITKTVVKESRQPKQKFSIYRS